MFTWRDFLPKELLKKRSLKSKSKKETQNLIKKLDLARISHHTSKHFIVPHSQISHNNAHAHTPANQKKKKILCSWRVDGGETPWWEMFKHLRSLKYKIKFLGETIPYRSHTLITPIESNCFKKKKKVEEFFFLRNPNVLTIFWSWIS